MTFSESLMDLRLTYSFPGNGIVCLLFSSCQRAETSTTVTERKPVKPLFMTDRQVHIQVQLHQSLTSQNGKYAYKLRALPASLLRPACVNCPTGSANWHLSGIETL